MNKVILMGRLTKDPEIRYTQGAQPIAICRYTLAVNRSYKRDGEPDADFINIVAFGNRGEFASKYFQKGQMVCVAGELRISSFEDKDGNKRYSTDVVATDLYFTGSKSEGQKPQGSEKKYSTDDFVPVANAEADEELPF